MKDDPTLLTPEREVLTPSYILGSQIAQPYECETACDLRFPTIGFKSSFLTTMMSRSFFKVLPKVTPAGATTIAHRRWVGQRRWKSMAFGKNKEDEISLLILRDEMNKLGTKVDTEVNKLSTKMDKETNKIAIGILSCSSPCPPLC